MNAAENWARDFYAGVFVDLWLGATTEEQTRREADFLEKMLGLPVSGAVVDLACGGGRHCLELAARGFRATGVDISVEFLGAARAAAARRGLSVEWEERALQDISWDKAFDGAICMGNSLGGLDDAGIAAVLLGAARALKPAARLVVETGFMAESLLPHFKPRDWSPLGDILYLAQRRYDPALGRVEMDYTFIRGAQTEKKSAFGQVYTFREFQRRVEEAGFHDIRAYSSVDQEPYQLGSPNLLLVATKC
jgi:SAM-dependent methyltransferase